MKNKLLLSGLFAIAFAISGFAQAQSTSPQLKTPAEKQAWIKANESAQLKKRNDFANAHKSTTPKVSVKNDNNLQSGQLVNEPGFPPYINTGDKAKDDANYKSAKDKWIQDNPERYKEMTGHKKTN